MPRDAVGHDTRLVWRLFSPSARQLKCQMQTHPGRFELVIADDRGQQIIRTSFDELASLHRKASDLRQALEARGYVPFGYDRPTETRIGMPSEARAAFCGLIECAELLSLDKRGVSSALREAATTGLVAVGLQDIQMTRDAISTSRAALSRAADRRAGSGALLDSCEALLARVESTLPLAVTGH